MIPSDLFDVGKSIDVDLSHTMGLPALVNDYDVISTVKFTHHTKITSEFDSMDALYFDIGNDDEEGMLLKADKEWFYFKLVHSALLETQDEYNDAVENLEEESLPFENDVKSFTFRTLSTNWNLIHGIEKVIASKEPEFTGKALDAVYRFFTTEHEYMFAAIVEGELSLYVGVQISEGKIL